MNKTEKRMSRSGRGWKKKEIKKGKKSEEKGEGMKTVANVT